MSDENIASKFDRLEDLLDHLLPTMLTPNVPRNGIKLAMQISEMVGFKWEPASVRYYLSRMSSDPRSCITRYYDDKGKRRNGYVLRPASEKVWGVEKQLLAHKALILAEELIETLTTTGIPYTVLWTRINKQERDLAEAITAFNNKPRQQ